MKETISVLFLLVVSSISDKLKVFVAWMLNESFSHKHPFLLFLFVDLMILGVVFGLFALKGYEVGTRFNFAVSILLNVSLVVGYYFYGRKIDYDKFGRRIGVKK